MKIFSLDPARTLPAILASVFLSAAADAEVPLSWDSTGHIMAPVFVNGKGPFEFILDTGADESAVYARFAQSLNLPKGTGGEISGATGSEPMTSTPLAALAIDGHVIRHVNADTVPDRPDGVKLAGIVGADLMVHRLMVIDLGCDTVSVHSLSSATRKLLGAGATLIHAGAIADGQQLTLPVTVGGVSGVAMLDTGARDTIINPKFAALAGVDTDSAAFREGVPARGAAGKSVPSRSGPIGTVQFAGVTRRDVVTRVVDLPVFAGAGLADRPAMILGLDLLRGVRLSVDYSARRFWVAPSSCHKQSPNTRTTQPS